MYTPVKSEVFEYDYLFKVILIGNTGVGKSALMLRYTDRTFCDSYISTIGVDFKVKTLSIDGLNIKIQIWDTASQDYFRSITSLYYKNCQGCLLVYDITNEDSFEKIGYWLDEVKKYAPPDIVTYIVGNKCDVDHVQPLQTFQKRLKREVTTEEGKRRAVDLGLTYVETSAKYISDYLQQMTIDDIFLKMIRQLIHNNGGNRSYMNHDNGFPRVSNTFWSKMKSWFKCGCCC